MPMSKKVCCVCGESEATLSSYEKLWPYTDNGGKRAWICSSCSVVESIHDSYDYCEDEIHGYDNDRKL